MNSPDLNDKIVKILALFCLVLIDLSCKKKTDQNCQYPQVSFYEQINLNDIKYSNLSFDNRYIYYSNAGMSGVIVFHLTAGDYRTFERASPIAPTDPRANLIVDATGTLMKDTVNNQSWDLEGNAFVGSSVCQVFRYSTIKDGAYLKISSY